MRVWWTPSQKCGCSWSAILKWLVLNYWLLLIAVPCKSNAAHFLGEYLQYFSAGTDFRRLNLTSIDVTFWRLMSINEWQIIAKVNTEDNEALILHPSLDRYSVKLESVNTSLIFHRKKGLVTNFLSEIFTLRSKIMEREYNYMWW